MRKIKLMLMTFLVIACSTTLTACIITGDTLLKPLPPPGFVYLTHDGFRKVLKDRIDLKTCTELLSNRDSTIFLKDMQLTTSVMQSEVLQRINTENEVANRKLKRMVFWKNVEIWALRGGLAFAVFKLITK